MGRRLHRPLPEEVLLRVGVGDKSDHDNEDEGDYEKIVFNVAVPFFRLGIIRFPHCVVVFLQGYGRFAQGFVDLVVDEVDPLNETAARVQVSGDRVEFEERAKVAGAVLVRDKLVEVVKKTVVRFSGDGVRIFRVVFGNGVQEDPIVRPPNGRVHLYNALGIE